MVERRESQYVKKLLDKIYFVPPQLPLFGEPEKFYLEDLENKGGKLFYLKDGIKRIEESSLVLYFNDEKIGEYSSRKIAEKLGKFKNRMISLIESNKPQVGVVYVITGETVTIKEMMKKEMKNLAEKLFKN